MRKRQRGGRFTKWVNMDNVFANLYDGLDEGRFARASLGVSKSGLKYQTPIHVYSYQMTPP